MVPIENIMYKFDVEFIRLSEPVERILVLICNN